MRWPDIEESRGCYMKCYKHINPTLGPAIDQWIARLTSSNPGNGLDPSSRRIGTTLLTPIPPVVRKLS